MPKLSLIVPVYNEAPHLESVIHSLMSSVCPIEREWIFVDDCSNDTSANILRKMSQQYQFKVIQQETNQGKGASVIAGIQMATGDFIIIQDADFEYNPNDISHLITPILNNEADVVFGSRFIKYENKNFHYWVNRFLTTLSNLFSGLKLSDMETCYKLYRSEILKSMVLTSKRFGIEIELAAYTAKLKARIVERPISYSPRTHKEGKKIGWTDGVAALFHILRFNLFTSKKTAFRPPSS